MSSQKNRYNLFGLDLAAVARFFLEGLAEAADWPVFRWLSPRQPVRVTDAAGHESIRLGVSSVVVDFKGRVDRRAVELPEELLLRRSLVMPRLSDADLDAAVALDARSASPFTENDLVWGFARRAGGASDDRLKLESVLSSRSQIERYLLALGGTEAKSFPEVWAGGESPIVVRGFGENDRRRRGGVYRGAVLALALLAVLLVAALALTPLLQLRMQVLDAMARNQTLLKSSTPQAALRADLMRFNANLELVNDFVVSYANPLVVLDDLSRLLPDDVVVNTLEFKGSTVRVSGQASNPAKLLDILAAQPGYQEVKAPSATTRVQGSSKEYFAIEFKIKRTEKKQ